MRHVFTVALLCALTACGGGGGGGVAGAMQAAVLTANPASIATSEDAPVSGALTGVDPAGSSMRFAVVETPSRGSVDVDEATGRFTYSPSPDEFGEDQFTFTVNNGASTSAPATVNIHISAINDPPRIAAVSSLQNSPDAEWVYHDLEVVDVDRETPELSVQLADPTIAEAYVDPSVPNRLLFRSKRVGATAVTVTASDAVSTTTTQFDFRVERVIKTLELAVDSTTGSALRFRNDSDRTVDFVLTHNGFKAFENVEDVVEHVRAMPAQFPGEQFDRKLWRFVRDSVYHDVPLSADVLLYDPWVTLNSLGWGFCGHVASVFVEVARAAGYEARLWGLNGHVVPEILVDGEWHMFDPDLAVYYKDASGRVAGVQQLTSDPSLITNPVDPIFAGSTYQFPYTTTISDIYGSTSDNFDGETTFLDPRPSPSSKVVLPAQATLTYPGRWTEAPTGYDGTIPYTVRSFRQAMIELPDTFSGEVALPWLLWDVQGGGTVTVGGDSFAIGSSQLTERLRTTTQPITTINVQSGAGVRLIFMVNTTRYGLQPVNHVALEGVDVWAIAATIETGSLALGAFADTAPVVDEATYAKPLPTIQGL